MSAVRLGKLSLARSTRNGNSRRARSERRSLPWRGHDRSRRHESDRGEPQMKRSTRASRRLIGVAVGASRAGIAPTALAGSEFRIRFYIVDSPSSVRSPSEESWIGSVPGGSREGYARHFGTACFMERHSASMFDGHRLNDSSLRLVAILPFRCRANRHPILNDPCGCREGDAPGRRVGQSDVVLISLLDDVCTLRRSRPFFGRLQRPRRRLRRAGELRSGDPIVQGRSGGAYAEH